MSMPSSSVEVATRPRSGPCLQLVLDEQSLLARDRPVVRSHELFAGELVDARRQALGEASRVDEDDRRAMRLDQLEQARIDRGPDAVAGPAASPPPRRVATCPRPGPRRAPPSSSAGRRRRSPPRGRRRRGIAPTSSSGRCVADRPMRCGSTFVSAHSRSRLSARWEPRLVAATEWISSTMTQRTDARMRRAALVSSKYERFRRGDEDVRRMALHRAPGVSGCVAGADGRVDVGRRPRPMPRAAADAHQRRPQVAVDVVGEGLHRGHIKDATALPLRRHRLGHEAVEAPEEGGQRLAAAGRGGHERVPPGGHLLPAALLDVGRPGEGGAEPVPSRRREEVERRPHAIKSDHFRNYKQVFVNIGTGLRSRRQT